jgi:hypothetical protein
MPARSHKSDILILTTLGVIAVLVLGALVSSGWLRREEPAFPMRTTHSTRASGTMACYMLFERFGIDVQRSERPLLADHLKGLDVVILIEPLYPLEDGEQIGLRAWIRGGGLLVCSDNGLPGPHDEHGWGMHDVTRHPDAMQPTYSPDERRAMPLARDVSSTRFQSASAAPLHDAPLLDVEEDAAPLYADTAGARIVSYRIGDGGIIVLADTSFLSNAWISQADNAILAANLVEYALNHARGSRVAFDEYHFGYGGRPSGFSLFGVGMIQTSLGWCVLCLMLAGVLYLVYKGRRFGTRYPATRTRRRTKLEYVHSVGATYRVARAHGLALELVYAWFRRTMAAAVGLPASAPPDVLAGALARRTLHGPHQYEEILRRCEQTLAEPRVGARRAQVLLDQLARIEMEVLDGRRTRK